MPILSKKVISHIEGLGKPFSRAEIITSLLSGDTFRKDKKTHAKKNKKSGKKGKKTISDSHQSDVIKINDIINALISGGFLKKNRKNFIEVISFEFPGTIKMTSGHGTIETESGVEITVKKDDSNHAHNNDRVIFHLNDYHKGIYYGRVKAFANGKPRRYFARFSRITGSMIYFEPVDVSGTFELCTELKKLRNIDRKDLEDTVFLLEPEKGLLGSVQKCLVHEFYHIDDESWDIPRIVIKNSLPGEYPDFPELEDIEKNLPAAETDGREDMRDIYTITIDGDNAKDFDDAVSLKKSGKKWILHVHIADVSAYVRKGGDLDREAYERGTSYYLGNRVIPMLHEKLSNNLCSLREKEEKFSVTAEMHIDSTGNIVEKKFFRSIIRVDKRLTYRIADIAIDNDPSSAMGKMLTGMHVLAMKLKELRLKNGRLDLNLTDTELVYEKDTFKGIEYSPRLKSHTIIEEFMLSANEAVAEELKDTGIPSLFRVHEKISQESLATLTAFIKTLGLKLKKSANMGISIQDVLGQVKGHDNEHVVNLIVLKSLMQAYYGAEPLGHFGLGFENYTHFTSPIRRYPDLVVHRCIKSILSGESLPYSMQELVQIGEKSSELERIAQTAERDLIKLKSCRFMKSHIGKTFKAVVSGMIKSGFFISLIEYPVEGMVPFFLLKDDYYDVYDGEYSVIGRRTGKIFRLGQKINVKLQEVKIDRMQMDFIIV